MKLVWTLSSWDDYEFWQRTDARMVEPLKGDMAGYWSRRITAEHRFVYRVSGSGSEQRLEIIQCRFHYL
jgi:toxin YoeB